ncbi:hypothetical protein [Mesotoga sp. Brook.08.YT.4.2.5.4.]|uniref:hypothetical protein n=1 Tax=Mesotoga sp. Brook.08.YT.4.2.5.4. TaxID=1343998 RepID=UPI000DC5D5AA|nr:hypothetical protein [Mesotoga sp. Brook.08.YT.4.2.5.4.]RAO96865.1 hypothetical protein M388_02200 [Mesotoga sp. Brook.08.YT.4.2.5.4.]
MAKFLVSKNTFACLAVFRRLSDKLKSQVPGGLGVFEALTIVILSPAYQADALMATLILYRIVFYIAPFLIALVVFGVNEFLFTGFKKTE